MLRNKIIALLLLSSAMLNAQTSHKLSGTIIGTEYSVDYSNGSRSTTVNVKGNAFDGKLNTFFASYDRSFTWVGLDLSIPHVITRVRWSPRNDGNGPKRVQLALFEGANMQDFSDAFPLYLNDTEGVIGRYQSADVNVSKGFRYVRYVGPNNSRCNVAEVEFYGYADEGTNDTYYRPTNLPVVSIHVENAQEPYDKENALVCSVTLIPADKNDTVKVKSGTVRLRGNASMSFPKKPYRITFDKKHHVFGSPASAKKWVLINNYGDKTLMRNILAFDMSRRMEMEYTPFCIPVDVFVNGEYKGCYQLADQIEVNKNRVNIEPLDNTITSGSELTGGYLIEVDAYANKEAVYFQSSKGNPVTVKYPDDEDINIYQRNYIMNKFNNLEARLYSSNYTSSNGYRSLMDLDSFLRHFIVGEFSGNTDTYWSVNMYKHRNDEHFYVGPVWDFDLAYENDNRTYPINDLSGWIYASKGSCAGNFRDFVTRIVIFDERAKTRLSELWQYARDKREVTEETLLKYVDDLAAELNASQRLNYIRWDNLSQYVHQNWQACGSYKGEVDIIKNYISKRIAWFDRKLKFDPTGIEDVQLNDDDNVANHDIYTLDGKNVGRDIDVLPKGVYIRNGKKLLIR